MRRLAQAALGTPAEAADTGAVGEGWESYCAGPLRAMADVVRADARHLLLSPCTIYV